MTQGATVRTISYTADGNTLQDNSGTGVVLGYGYNNDNRMVQASLGGATQASYTLNYLGQRVIKSALTSGTTHFHYDRGGHLIAESDGTGAVQREYVYLGDMPVAFITPTGGIDIIHTDHLGTPQKMTDPTQAVVWDGGASDPFMMSALPTTPAMNQRLPGQYYDGETGLHSNYFRDYDPSLGRYVESDPIGLGGGISLYAYVGSDPTGFIDPFGLYEALVVHMPNGTSYIPRTRVKNDAQAAAFGLPIDTPVAIPVPDNANPQGDVDCWAQASDKSYKAFKNYWSDPNHDYKRRGSQFDAYGNFMYGATGEAAGYSLFTLQFAAGALHDFANDPINSTDIDSGYYSIDNGGTLGTTDWEPPSRGTN